MKIKIKTLVVDVNNLLFKAIHMNQHLTYKGVFTGGLHGVIAQLGKQLRIHNPNNVIFCLDSPPYSRSQALAEYKTNRKKNSAIFKLANISREQIAEFANFVGIHHWRIKGLEADDLIANICLDARNKSEIVILSDDSDLFQLLSIPEVTIYRRNDFYTKEMFSKAYPKVKLPDDWAWIHALTGGHNGLPGIVGIGDKKALKMVVEKTIPKTRETELFFKLAKLPYERIRCSHLLTPDRITETGLIRDFLLDKHGIKMSFSLESSLENLRNKNLG